MPDPLYTRLLETAKRLIDQYGKPAQVRRRTSSGSSYDPDFADVDYDINYVEMSAFLSDRDSSLIEQDDVVGIISMTRDAVIEAIDKSDALVQPDGKTLSFVYLKPLNPGGVELLTEFQAR